MGNQKVVSREIIKELVQTEGYFKFNRECKESDDRSIQEHYSLTPNEVTEIFKDNTLKGIRRSTKRSVVFLEDIIATPEQTEAVIQSAFNKEQIEEETEEQIEEEIEKETEEQIEEETEEQIEEEIEKETEEQIEEETEEQIEEEIEEETEEEIETEVENKYEEEETEEEIVVDFS